MPVNLVDKKYFVFCSDNIYQLLCRIVVDNFNNRITLIRCVKQVEVVDDKGDQVAIIRKYHERNNHRGITEVFNEIRRHYYWPNYHNDVIKYINKCDVCQKSKYDRHPVKSQLQITTKVTKPMDRIHCDVFKIKNRI